MTNYGCYDEIVNSEENSKNHSRKTRLRKCHWTRFLSLEGSSSRSNKLGNLVCFKHPLHSGQMVYEAVEKILPYTELVACASHVSAKPLDQMRALNASNLVKTLMQGKSKLSGTRASESTTLNFQRMEYLKSRSKFEIRICKGA